MTRPTIVLVHSPLVGPSTWTEAARPLRDKGFDVVVPSLATVVDGEPPFYPRLAEAVAEQTGDRPVVLVGHSGAGALLPAIADALPGEVRAAVFVDAVLPHPGRDWFAAAPPELGTRLESLAVAGRLPPWHEWFPPGALTALFPDAETYRRFVAELPTVPLAYFAERAPEAERWPPPACGYVRLSEPYDAVADECERLGWPVHRVAADHLAMLTRPGLVAGLVARLVAELTGE
ncbi:alpha/beta fold hydrolase [Prauserella flavalba]|uniref:AB hydrolase-1 domain-containing protein n=1 Tax=Prauserella flavalba TaxID=1477506 RepID=A0A318LEM7_9PSEU|nr:alpha/beta hydrolase [Prauserella flavalba]PXY24550.1 hypothetical protein BA062_27640 [Prauserella flavalba]